jgi:hypothetical protein
MNEEIERLKKWYEGRLKASEVYIEELKKELRFWQLGTLAVIIGGAFLNTHYPIWHIKFWLELLGYSGVVILSAIIIWLAGGWIYAIFLGIKWIINLGIKWIIKKLSS